MASVAASAADDCSWCGKHPWRFSCSTCDPRTTKHVCLECARRWHSRGFSQEHQLRDRSGMSRSYLEWRAHILSSLAAVDSSTTTATSIDTHASANEDKDVSVVEAVEEPEGADALAVAESIGDVGDFMVQVAASEKPTESAEEASSTSAEEDRDDEGDNADFGGGDEVAGANVGEEVPQDIPVHLSEQTDLELEEVLNRLPSDDPAILDALADHIHDMIRVEDSVLCHKFINCEAPACQSNLRHHRHVVEREVCNTPTCQAIASYLKHMALCRNRQCPFCVRIQQRRLFCKMHALDYFSQKQRRKLTTSRRDGGDQARENFIRDQIAAFEQRKRTANGRVESLNRMVVNERFPIFNFPRFSWHINQEPVIKEEPVLSEQSASAELSKVAQSEREATHRATEGEEKSETEQEEQGVIDHDGAVSVSGEDAANNSPASDGDVQEDYVASLIAKKDSGDQTAAALFDASVKQAFRIVDASFCSPGKASRCLLSCQSILLHLQHHVDLQVCKHRMCETVEQHFSHISMCLNEETDIACEYCLRVNERQFSRSVEVMEADQQETEVKIQRLVSAITTSLSEDPHDEREQNVMQLEDELQQAEDYKKALNTKIDTARMNLLKSRRRMKRHASNPPASFVTVLPLHWIKAARHSSPTKRRKT